MTRKINKEFKTINEELNRNQFYMLISFVFGMILVLSIFFFLEVPKILLNTNNILIIFIISLICVPLICHINYRIFQLLIKEWNTYQNETNKISKV